MLIYIAMHCFIWIAHLCVFVVVVSTCDDRITCVIRE